MVFESVLITLKKSCKAITQDLVDQSSLKCHEVHNSMEIGFLIKLGLSFCVGAIWVVLSTTIADVLGTKLGGLVAGLPSTVVITLLFVGLVQGTDAATTAAGTVPAAFSINGPFLLLFCLFIRRGLVWALGAALFPWILLSSILVTLGPPKFIVGVVIWLFTMSATYWLLENRFVIPSYTKGNSIPTRTQMLFRAALTGTVVSLGVLLSKIGGPIFGGVAASFPAVFLSSLIISYFSGGADFSRGLAKAMTLSGFINVVCYGIVGFFTFPILGLWSGSLVSLIVSFITGYLTYALMQTKMS